MESAALTRSAPNTLFVTGATGLLGSYLVRDLALDGRPLAVLARSGRRQSAVDRVETIYRGWEEALGRPLPRPRVLEGDVSLPLCGLDEAAVRWLARNCDEVLHNAASLTFRGPDRDGDPWRTNVGGTAGVLELARATGLHLLEQTLKRAGVRSLLTSRWLKRQAIPHPPDFHEQLVRAIMSRDPRVADEKMRDHLHFNETVDLRPTPLPAENPE